MWVVKDNELDHGQATLLVAGLVGQRTWSPRNGVGSMLTVELGTSTTRTVTSDGSVFEHGEWHLWLCECAWRVERSGTIVCGSNDEADRLALAVDLLDDREVERVTLSPLGDLVVELDGGVVLRAVPVQTDDGEHWCLFLPDRRVLSACGPGRFLAEQDSQPPAR
jgi:hypothetical protein